MAMMQHNHDMNRYYTLPEGLVRNPAYRGIQATLDRLCANPEVVQRFPGNCISASDIIQHILDFYGVKSKLVECQVMMIKGIDSPEKDFRFVGFNNVGLSPNTIDTHVVVVTESMPPVMIDGSLGNYLGEKNSLFIRELKPHGGNVMGEFLVDDLSITYQSKKDIKIPGLHQKNIIDRIEDELKVKERIKSLYVFVYILIAMSVTNMILNVALIILKMIWP